MNYTYQKNLDNIKKIDKILDDNNLSADVYMYQDDMPVICVEIHWGDWKHDHLRTKYLITKELDCTELREEVTEEDGSDCYSAIHYYVF